MTGPFFRAPLFSWQVSAERTPRRREWRPQIYRKCTDTAWLLLFFLFWAGLVSVAAWGGGRPVCGSPQNCPACKAHDQAFPGGAWVCVCGGRSR